MTLSLHRRLRLSSGTFLSILVISALTACGGGSTNNPPEGSGSGSGSGSGGGSDSSNPTATLSASPTTITVGQTVTLTWSTTNATSAQIDNGVGSATVPSGSTT